MEHYGMTGNILKIDLSSQSAQLVSTGNYADLSGGAPLAYRILLQELPTDLKDAYDEKNVLVLAAGFLTGSGLPASCSLTVAALSPLSGTPACAQLNSRLGPMLKQAGYDAVVLSGAASSPVWININNNEVKMESAAFLWGAGTHDTIAQVCASTGREAAVLAIGPAGENKLDIASAVTLGGAAADGFGGVFGSKNLKAIALRGSGAVGIAAPEAYAALRKDIDSIVGVPGGSVVPAESQSWSEFHSSTSWWNAAPGLEWGAAEVPVETGECLPADTARMGLRTLSVVRDFGKKAAQAVVRPVACPSCTSGCATLLHLPALERAGLSAYQLCGCEALRNARGFMPRLGELPEPEKEETDDQEEKTETAVDFFEYSDLEIAAAAASLAEDFGIGLMGGQLARNFRFAVDSGALKKAVSNTEYQSFEWEKYRGGDLNFLTDLFRRLAKNKEKVAALGTVDVAESWNFGEEYQTEEQAPICGMKRPLDADALHGGAEAALAALSADELRRPMTRLLDCGLPQGPLDEVIALHCGAEVALDYKGELLVPKLSGELMAWSAKQSYLCSLLGLCGRMWPLTATAAKTGDSHAADPLLPARMATVVTGNDIQPDLLEEEALAGLCAARALQCVHAKTLSPAQKLDTVNSWVTAGDITEGAIATAKERYYHALGWDMTAGLPDGRLLDSLSLSKAAELLAAVEEAEAED